MAEFGELPPLLNELGDEFKFYPFHYEHESRSFRFGSKALSINDSELSNELWSPSTKPVYGEEVLKHHLLIGPLGDPVSTPRFHDWFEKNTNEKVLLSTAQVIFDVFADTVGIELHERPTTARGVSAFGAEANAIRPGQPNLQTIGNCACTGPEIFGNMFAEEDWEYGFAEYGFHNIDRDEQRISLLAGLGHLAYLSTSSSQ